MNYLAHLYFADAGPEAIVGSLLGDFHKGRITIFGADDRLEAVRLHRKIDSYTDAHEVFRRSKRRVQPSLSRYSGILIDLFYDHFLIRQWSLYASIPVREFIIDVYIALRRQYHTLPPGMQRSVNYMLANDLLFSYRTLPGVRKSLQGLEKRLNRPYPLRNGVDDLKHCYAEFERDFTEFFPELIAYVDSYKKTRG